MNAQQLEFVESPLVADLVAYDKNGRMVLLVESLGGVAEQKALSNLKLYLTAAKTRIPFALLVDVDFIKILKWDGTNLSEPVIEFKAADVLSHYEPEFSNKQIFNRYLLTLVEVWLDDFAYHWKSKTPPAAAELAAIGLLQLVEDGETKSDVEIKGDSVR